MLNGIPTHPYVKPGDESRDSMMICNCGAEYPFRYWFRHPHNNHELCINGMPNDTTCPVCGDHSGEQILSVSCGN